MIVQFRPILLTKRYPLRISRGVSTGSTNLFVQVSDGTHIGLGECAPGTGHNDQTFATAAQEALSKFVERHDLAQGPHQVWADMEAAGLDRAYMAGVDIALWDLLGKQAKLPLRALLGLPRKTVATSVTIGINPPEVIAERVPEILHRTGAKHLKVKLGSPEGLDSDKASYLAVIEASKGSQVSFRVDANGGWNLNNAQAMVQWLADHGCDYVEQPLSDSDEPGLDMLFEGSPLPIFLDEWIRSSGDVARFSGRCHGVNLKLMKTGGLTEALRVVATARANGLKTMIGCMGESPVAISAGASLGALFDHIDLDSHLNLLPGPVSGSRLEDGAVWPTEVPGHGALLD
ncbi:MAG: dipeptide epimerase [Chthonomonadaceae bacterium]|nr:dipeptide epimerase [Chthonomonadaceae bacterium]